MASSEIPNSEVGDGDNRDSQETYCEESLSQRCDVEKSSSAGDTSSDVVIIKKSPCLIILPSDTESLSEKNGSATPTHEAEHLPKKRKIEINTPSNQQVYSVESSQLSSTEVSSSETLKLQKLSSHAFHHNIFKCDITPVKTPSGCVSRRRNSFSCKDNAHKPMRRLKRCASVDIDTIRTAKDTVRVLHKSKEPNFTQEKVSDAFSTIQEERTCDNISVNGSQNVNTTTTSDSQQVVLQYFPDSVDISDPSQKSQCLSNDVRLNTDEDSQNGFKCDSVPVTNLADENYLDSTVSINMDSTSESDFPNNHALKSKSYLSNGCVASTPEIVPYNNIMHCKLKAIQNAENDTPPLFQEYNKPSIYSGMPKLDHMTSGNSSISPITNGHSDRINPTFDVQIHCDANNEFLSLIVVKTDSSHGANISKEYQKISRRTFSDHYSADGSKSSSPSSATSGGLLTLPAHTRSSILSSSGSTSSNRTHDGTFAIPLRRNKNFPVQNCVSVKGLSALKTKVQETIMHLQEIYHLDDTDHSPPHTLERKSENNTFEGEEKQSLSNGEILEISNTRLVTPRSTKKRFQARNKRNGNKTKKNLPSTTEEIHINGEIHSPEMIPCDSSKCPRPLTPIKNSTGSDLSENNNSPRSTAKGKLKKEPASNLTASPKNKNGQIKSDIVTYCPGTLVLAKWVDKCYYPGIVKKSHDGNKYTIEFYDGQIKNLLDDFIIFGNARELPILGQSIYAIVEKGRYEPSLVLSLVEDENGSILYRCTTDRDVTVSVKVSDIYVTEDQAKSIRDNCSVKSPQSAPNTPRRRVNRELDLDNIIQGPRSARLKNNSKDTPSRSPEASTSGLSQKRRSRKTIQPKQRQESESSEGGDGSVSRAPSSVALEEVSGVQPEIQKTPRKLDGVKIAGPILIKGVSKQNTGKRYSKVTKFENDSDTNKRLGPIPSSGSTLFKDLHFLLTCTNPPPKVQRQRLDENISQDSIGSFHSDSESQCTDKEDCSFTKIPFQKDRIKEQLEAGGGVVYSHFEDIPKDKYSICKLIAPRPCFTAKYIQCLAADIKALTHSWVVRSCLANKLADMDEDVLPTGWSIEKSAWINWKLSSHTDDRLSSTPFKDSLILLCSDSEMFLKFWRRVCSLAGGNTRTINEDDLDVSDGFVIVTEADCPHEVQNKAIYSNIPLVSTRWVVQCLIEGRLCEPTASFKYNFAYNEPD